MEANELAVTPLHDLHVDLGAKMVPFAGYSMPVQYPAGVLTEHRHTRSQAGLFDVSHMGQVRLHGAQAACALERLVPMDIIDLPVGRQRYALFISPDGTILDDLMVARTGSETFQLVVNAARKAHDFAHLSTLADECAVEPLTDLALLALQGPGAVDALSSLNKSVATMKFMDVARVMLGAIPALVSRSGYTGEDGFEISVANEHAEALAQALLAVDSVAPIGLGARDSLRLEAGLCLYGHDIDNSTNPVEAALSWSIQKVRRANGARAGGFPGAEHIFTALAAGPARRRVGLRPHGKAPVREGTELILASSSPPAGQVTSGGFGPTVGGPVAMGYLPAANSAPGTEVFACVRGRELPMTVVKLPFVTARYLR